MGVPFMSVQWDPCLFQLFPLKFHESNPKPKPGSGCLAQHLIAAGRCHKLGLIVDHKRQSKWRRNNPFNYAGDGGLQYALRIIGHRGLERKESLTAKNKTCLYFTRILPFRLLSSPFFTWKSKKRGGIGNFKSFNKKSAITWVFLGTFFV